MVIKTPTQKDIEHLLADNKNGPKTGFPEWKERIINFVNQQDMNAEMFYITYASIYIALFQVRPYSQVNIRDGH